MKTSAFKADSNGNVTDLSNADNVVIVDAARTLTKADSGKVFILKAAAGVAVTLPTPIAGFKAKFIVGLAFATTNFTIVATSNVIQGGADVNSTFVPAANENTISFVATAETLGDYVEITSDGTNFYVNGVGTGAGAITFTAV
jgi:hypothetical protein